MWRVLRLSRWHNATAPTTFSSSRRNPIIVTYNCLSWSTCCWLDTRWEVVEVIEHEAHVGLMVIYQVPNYLLLVLNMYGQIAILISISSCLREKVAFEDIIAFELSNVPPFPLMRFYRPWGDFWCKDLTLLAYKIWIVHCVSHHSWVLYNLNWVILLLIPWNKLRSLTRILTFENSTTKLVTSIKRLESSFLDRWRCLFFGWW